MDLKKGEDTCCTDVFRFSHLKKSIAFLKFPSVKLSSLVNYPVQWKSYPVSETRICNKILRHLRYQVAARAKTCIFSL